MSKGPCETRIMTMILGNLMKLETDGNPIHVWRANTGAAVAKGGRVVHFGEPGQADIQCVVRGHFIGIETKSEDGRVSEDQKTWRDKVVAAGGTYVVARCLDDAMTPVRARLGAR